MTIAGLASSIGRRVRPLLVALAGRERVLPIGIAALLLVASVLSVAPGASSGATGNVFASDGTITVAGAAPRLAIGDGFAFPSDELQAERAQADAGSNTIDGPAGRIDAGQLQPVLGSDTTIDPGGDTTLAGDAADAVAAPDATAAPDTAAPDTAAGGASPAPSGAYLPDGTLLKPVAVDTSVPDAKDRLTTYRVASGDTLTGIARHFGLSMMTIWWANDLASKDALHIGQTLVIPPVDGLVVTVKDGDTLAALAKATGIGPDRIARYNGLATNELIVGQTLIVPGGRGDAIQEPRPTSAPATSATASRGSAGSGGSGGASGGTSARPPAHYGGGSFAWPVPGGYISQYFHYGHYALDIAADMGSPVHAAAAGTIIFAGWKNNGGGYQVWIAHGSNIYTAYYHMSAVTVGIGQHVGRGQQVGRVGMTGWATGPHTHFEVWIGPIMNGGHRVNPLGYL